MIADKKTIQEISKYVHIGHRLTVRPSTMIKFHTLQSETQML